MTFLKNFMKHNRLKSQTKWQNERSVQIKPHPRTWWTHLLRIFSACCSEMCTPRSLSDCMISCESMQPARRDLGKGEKTFGEGVQRRLLRAAYQKTRKHNQWWSSMWPKRETLLIVSGSFISCNTINYSWYRHHITVWTHSLPSFFLSRLLKTSRSFFSWSLR